MIRDLKDVHLKVVCVIVNNNNNDKARGINVTCAHMLWAHALSYMYYLLLLKALA